MKAVFQVFFFQINPTITLRRLAWKGRKASPHENTISNIKVKEGIGKGIYARKGEK
jgi:hypothetical protein